MFIELTSEYDDVKNLLFNINEIVLVRKARVNGVIAARISTGNNSYVVKEEYSAIKFILMAYKESNV